jgi:hypothetical protein
MFKRCALWVVVIGVLTSACNGNTATSPTPPTAAPAPPSGAPPPTTSGLGTISGVVFEMTSSGRVPVEGVYVTGPWDYPVTTDGNGSFSLSRCGDSPCVFRNGDLFTAYLSKDGYRPATAWATINGDTQLDIQLMRR